MKIPKVLFLGLMFMGLTSCQNPMSETGYSVLELNHVEFSYKGANGHGYLRSPMLLAPTSFEDHGLIATCSINPELPLGLMIENETCAISGTPLELSPETLYTVTAINDAGETTADVTLKITPGKPTLKYQESYTAIADSYFEIQPEVFFDNESSILSCTSDPDLPGGLILDQNTCVISGVPSSFEAQKNYSITAKNHIGVVEANFKLNVSDFPIISFDSDYPEAKVGLYYQIQPLTLNSMGSPLLNCSASPNLPPGLSINPKTCLISGTPQTPTNLTTYTITATNSAGSRSSSLDFEVIPSPPVLSYSGSQNEGYISFPMIVTPTLLSNEGSPLVGCEISPSLPEGLSFNTSTCEISGIPLTVIKNSNFVVTVSNLVGSSVAVVKLTINPSPPTIRYSTSSFSGTFGEEFSLSPQSLVHNGEFITHCSISPQLPNGIFIDPYTCQISGTVRQVTPQTSYTISVTNEAGTSTTSFNLITNPSLPELSYEGSGHKSGFAKSYRQIFPRILNKGGVEIDSCTILPTLPEGFSIDQNSCIISGSPIYESPSTTYNVTVSNRMGSYDATLTLSTTPIAPELSFEASEGKSGSAQQAMLIVPTIFKDGGARDFSCSISPELPEGLTLNSQTCIISGTPPYESSTTSYTVTLSNSAGSDSSNLEITIAPIPPTLSFSGVSGNIGKIEDPMSIIPQLNKGGTSTYCTISPALPLGLSLSSTDCIITGTPISQSDQNYLLTVSNSAGSDSSDLRINIGPNTPVISFSNASGTVGTYVSYSPTELRNRGSEILDCTAASLPEGLSIDAYCNVSGTPTTAGNGQYLITVSNSVGSTTTTLPISIAAIKPTLSFTGSSGTLGTVGSAMSISPIILLTGGAPITSCTGSLPAGLSLNSSTCVISGTPTWAQSSKTHTITVKNSSNLTHSATLSISITATAPHISYSQSSTGYVGVARTITPNLNNGGTSITNCTVSPSLPSGLSLNKSTCVISGTPTAPVATRNYTVTAYNAAGYGQGNISITVSGYLCKNNGFDGPTTGVGSLSQCWYDCSARGYDGGGKPSSLNSCYYHCESRNLCGGKKYYPKTLSSCTDKVWGYIPGPTVCEWKTVYHSSIIGYTQKCSIVESSISCWGPKADKNCYHNRDVMPPDGDCYIAKMQTCNNRTDKVGDCWLEVVLGSINGSSYREYCGGSSWYYAYKYKATFNKSVCTNQPIYETTSTQEYICQEGPGGYSDWICN